ncbi:MAG: threonylcarbamoyl-AMP synthase [Clostridia bacterium]|nr:threonylcarbamoyl-AMP synthase [Clostridia bacterium]
MSAKLIRVTDEASFAEAVELAAAYLQEGKLVVFPTETVYGIGCNALDEIAVGKLYRAKQRPLDKPLLLHLYSIEQAKQYSHLQEDAESLLNRFTPGPLSVIVKKKTEIPSIVTSGGDTVGLRFPDEPLFLAIARKAVIPIAATSANLSGFVSAKDGEAAIGLSEIADLIIDGGPCRFSIESTILSLLGERPKILREGAIRREEITEVIGPCD